MNNRTSLYLDFKYEIDNISLDDDIEANKSYHYMVTKLEEALKQPDDSISVEEIKNLLNLLQNSDNALSECYFTIISVLES